MSANSRSYGAPPPLGNRLRQLHIDAELGGFLHGIAIHAAALRKMALQARQRESRSK